MKEETIFLANENSGGDIPKSGGVWGMRTRKRSKSNLGLFASREIIDEEIQIGSCRKIGEKPKGPTRKLIRPFPKIKKAFTLPDRVQGSKSFRVAPQEIAFGVGRNLKKMSILEEIEEGDFSAEAVSIEFKRHFVKSKIEVSGLDAILELKPTSFSGIQYSQKTRRRLLSKFKISS